MTRVVREKLLGEGRFHGQLKFSNAKLLPLPGMSELGMPWHTENSGGTDCVTVCRAPVPHLPLSVSEDQGSFDQVCRSCRRRLRVRILAVPVLPWCQGKATSPSSLVRHQREGTLLPRAVLAGRMFFPT